MRLEELRGVAVDRCPACGARWFDRGELERVARAATGKGSLDERRLWRDAERFKGNLTERGCPDCGLALVELSQGAAAPVIEMCPRCYGVLLDRGELERLLALLRREGLLEVVEKVLDGETTPAEAAGRLRRLLSDALLRLAVELEEHHPYLRGLLGGMERALG